MSLISLIVMMKKIAQKFRLKRPISPGIKVVAQGSTAFPHDRILALLSLKDQIEYAKVSEDFLLGTMDYWRLRVNIVLLRTPSRVNTSQPMYDFYSPNFHSLILVRQPGFLRISCDYNQLSGMFKFLENYFSISHFLAPLTTIQSDDIFAISRTLIHFEVFNLTHFKSIDYVHEFPSLRTYKINLKNAHEFGCEFCWCDFYSFSPQRRRMFSTTCTRTGRVHTSRNTEGYKCPNHVQYIETRGIYGSGNHCAEGSIFDGVPKRYGMYYLKHLLLLEIEFTEERLIEDAIPPSFHFPELRSLKLTVKNAKGLCDWLCESLKGSKKLMVFDFSCHLIFFSFEFLTRKLSKLEYLLSLSLNCTGKMKFEDTIHLNSNLYYLCLRVNRPIKMSPPLHRNLKDFAFYCTNETCRVVFDFPNLISFKGSFSQTLALRVTNLLASSKRLRFVNIDLLNCPSEVMQTVERAFAKKTSRKLSINVCRQ